MKITLSHRVSQIKPSPTLSLSAAANQLKASGKPIINLTVGLEFVSCRLLIYLVYILQEADWEETDVKKNETEDIAWSKMLKLRLKKQQKPHKLGARELTSAMKEMGQ